VKAKAAAAPDIAVWIMALGIVFSLALVLTAVFNENPWADHTYGKAPPILAGAPSPHMDARDNMVCSSCHIVLPAQKPTGPSAGGRPTGVLPIAQGTPSPHRDGRSEMPCANCHTILPKGGQAAVPAAPVASDVPPSLAQAVTVAMTLEPPALETAEAAGEAHERMVSYRYQGKIVKMAGTGATTVWGDIFILVDDGINEPLWINLAPSYFLQASGCAVRPGIFVKGTAFRDPAQGNQGLAYAASVMSNGEVCALRDNHLKGLWLETGGADVEER